jgi:type IX secretion system PorP/SprF family membrane protein
MKAQHSFLYSQYYFSGILINPAYAGSQDALNLTSIYRNQWTGLEGAPCNLSIAGHSPLKDRRMNLGLVFLNNQYGLTRETRLSAVYAYRLPLGKGSLSFGLQGGIDNTRNDWSKIETTETSDPVFENAQNNVYSAIAGFGTYYKNEKMFLGLSAPLLYDSRKSFKMAYVPVLVCAGYLIKANENVVIKPGILLKYIKSSPLSIDISAVTYLKEFIGLGVGWRSSDAVYGLLDLKLNDQFSIGYCYDYTLSPLNNYSNGSHEFMLRYLFNYKLSVKSPRYF